MKVLFLHHQTLSSFFFYGNLDRAPVRSSLKVQLCVYKDNGHRRKESISVLQSRNNSFVSGSSAVTSSLATARVLQMARHLRICTVQRADYSSGSK